MERSVMMTLLYEDGLWQLGRQALSDAMKGDGAQLLNIADLSSERQPDGSYRTNATFAITAVNCLDHPGVADDAWVEEQAENLAVEFPTFGASLGGDGCRSEERRVGKEGRGRCGGWE